MKNYLLILFALMLSGCKYPLFNITKQPSSLPKNALVVAWGQSNMVGLEDYDFNYASNLKVWEWQALEDGNSLHATGYQRGPGYRFAKLYLAQRPDAHITVVNCARTGTSIAEWQPGGQLYNQCVDLVKRARTKDMTLVAMLVFQGEEDGIADTQDWAEQFENTVRSFRHSLHSGGLLTIYGQIGKNALNAAGWESIKTQQASVSMHNVFMIKSDDLDYFWTVHFTPQAYQTIAQRFFNVYMDQTIKD